MSVTVEQGAVERQGAVEQIAAQQNAGPKTPAQILREAYEAAKESQAPKDIMLPGYGEPVSELHLLFDLLKDYEDARSIVRAAMLKRGLRPADRELQIGIETLAQSARESYALIDGEKHRLPALGLDLYDALFQDDGSVRPVNDAQAIMSLFKENTTLLMATYAEVDQWMRRGGRDAEETALGN